MVIDNKMKLPEGKTCSDCMHCYRCTSMFGAEETNTTCDFYPVRFVARFVAAPHSTEGAPQ